MIYKFSMGKFVEMVKARQQNKYDCRIAISGPRGVGKSTFAFKFLSYWDDFDPWKQQVYSRGDVIKLMESQKFGIIFDDETISSGYKREFWDQQQQKLIKMVNMYRDNFNLHCSLIPNFYSLDKDLRSLTKIHVHIVRRGWAIIHLSNSSSLYQDDPWNIAYNKKVEEAWERRKKKDPLYSPPYHNLSTFRGYLKFGDLGVKQRALYEKIKVVKRKLLYEQEFEESVEENPLKKFVDKTYDSIKKGIISSMDDIKMSCFLAGFDYEYANKLLNIRIQKDNPLMTATKLIAQGEEDRPTSNPLSISTDKSIIPKVDLH